MAGGPDEEECGCSAEEYNAAPADAGKAGGIGEKSGRTAADFDREFAGG